MTLFRRQESMDGRNSLLVAELTNGQLVIMISVALFIAAVCFGAGILSARAEHGVQEAEPVAAQPTESAQTDPKPSQDSPPSQSSPQETATVDAGPPQTYTIPVMEAGTSKPAEVSTEASNPIAATQEPISATVPAVSAPTEVTPPPVQVAAAPPETPQQIIPVTPAIPPTPKPSPLEAGTKPRLTELPPLPSQPSVAESPSTPVKSADVVPIIPVEPPAETSTPPTPNQPVPSATPTQAPAPPPMDNASAAKKDVPPVAKPDKPAVVPIKNGKFVIQLGLFSGPDRKSNAEDLRKHVKKDFSITTQTIESDSVIRVIIGGFADKNAASTACADIRKKPGLTEAFVRPL